VALLGVLFVTFLSNFEGPLEVAHWNGLGSDSLWRWMAIADLDRPASNQGGATASDRLTRPGWWWWRASRVIFDYSLEDWPQRSNPNADPPPQRRENIDEFPFFSFLLGDMHPHVLALPFLMLALTTSLNLFHLGRERPRRFRLETFLGDRRRNVQLLFFALIFGALGFLNTWDFPIQWALAVGAFGIGHLSVKPLPSNGELHVPARRRLRPVLNLAIILAVGGLLLYAPFYIGFQSQAGGPLVHVHSSTRLAHFMIMFGPLLLILNGFLVWGIWRAHQRGSLSPRPGLWSAAFLLVSAVGILLLTALAIVVSPEVRSLVAPGLVEEEPLNVAVRYLGMRLSTPWVTVLLALMIAAGISLLSSDGFSASVRFALLLLVAGGVTTLTPDYVYLKDVFGVRLNTIFKFYFQAWLFWAVAAALAVYAVLMSEDRLPGTIRWLSAGLLALIVVLGLVYPILAIPDRVTEFPEAPTLDGTAYLAQDHPDDYAAVEWLNTQVDGAPTILETPGGAYQYEGRVSAQTGLPTLLGWAGHEHQWRGNTTVQDQRRQAIQELCSTTDSQRTLTLLDEYDITYVYVGPLERANCPASGLSKFARLMETVYDRDGVTIYKRPTTSGGPIGD
jgi:YYY domain-containing protein